MPVRSFCKISTQLLRLEKGKLIGLSKIIANKLQPRYKNNSSKFNRASKRTTRILSKRQSYSRLPRMTYLSK